MTFISRQMPTGCGCDETLASSPLIGIDLALAKIATRFWPVQGTERIALSDAKGRVLAEEVCARSDMPRFDHSAMDGYAIRRADLSGEGPWNIPVSLRCAAGCGPAPALREGSAARIFTGAPVPGGSDCVIMQEAVELAGDRIEISKRPAIGENIRYQGEEQRAGSLILPSGSRLTSRAIAAAAAGGHGDVLVRRKLRVALLVSGSEVISPGSLPAEEGAIWDVNTPMLRAALSRPDIQLVDVRTMPDNAEDIRSVLAKAAKVCDLIVTTGGVSVGDEDHLHAAFRSNGGVEVFSGVAMKPGKPVSCGTVDGVAWLGLPGNPQSAFVTWTLFGTALLARLTGLDAQHQARRHAVLSQEMHRKAGRCEVRAAYVLGFDGCGREIVDCTSPVSSGQVGALSAADGLVFLPADAECLPEAALIEFLPFCSD